MLFLIDLMFLVTWGTFIYNNPWQGVWFGLLVFVFLYSMRVHDKNQIGFSKQLLRSVVALLLSVTVYLLFKGFFGYNFSWKPLLFYILFSLFVLVPLRLTILKALGLKKRKYYLVCQDSVIPSFLKELQEEDPSVIFERIHKLSEGTQNVFFDSESTMKLFNGKVAQRIFLPKFVEKKLKRIPVELIEAYPNYYKDVFKSRQDTITKRILDMIVATLALVILSPLIAITAVAIYLEDGTPIIFKQKRIGKDGKEFTLYKFRSMKNAVSLTPRYADQEHHRITKVGKFIRKYRIDELPQFINVLKGDMSIVGPRPEQPIFHEELCRSIPFFNYRVRVKPGITGWAQVNYKYTTNFEEYKKKLEYDLWYVKNGNLWIDIKTMLHTLDTVIFGKGAR